MTDTHHTQPSPGRSLHRSADKRIVAGVAGGLGEHLGANPWWFRWAFIILAFFGGAGFFIYVVAWLAIPGPDENDSVLTRGVKKLDTSDTGTIFAVVLIGLAVVVLAAQVFDNTGGLVFAAVLFLIGILLYRGDLSIGGGRPDGAPQPHGPPAESASTGTVPPVAAATLVDSGGGAVTVDGTPPPPPAPATPPKPPREPSILGRVTVALGLIVIASMALLDVAFADITVRPVHYFAATLGVIGVGLIVGAFVGRARWLIVLGIVLAPIVWMTAFIPTTWNFSAGDFTHRPADATELETTYEQGAGKMTLDLRRLSPEVLQDAGPISVNMGFGEVVVLLPDDVGLDMHAEVGAGEIKGPFRSVDGAGLDIDRVVGSAPFVRLDIEVGLGAVKIEGAYELVVDAAPLPRILERSSR